MFEVFFESWLAGFDSPTGQTGVLYTRSLGESSFVGVPRFSPRSRRPSAIVIVRGEARAVSLRRRRQTSGREIEVPQSNWRSLFV